ncbi:9-O-acetylesterase [Coprobacter secundus subsp. similis]|uniref:9-O-acetylesterase n=2 Tax=Coprobacter secundus TaxID=1501392 RepID=A0A7G1HWZ7_9BACT|nr:9-O-acetylesterase [Coprobacter secundus subsp. similis]
MEKISGMKKIIGLSFALQLICISIYADVRLPALFTDNMVLQQCTDAPFWGEAAPNKVVKVMVGWEAREYETKSDNKGYWNINIPTPKFGGPYSITISDGKKVVLRNVMIGEVWICSGQSNMEMPLAGWGKIQNYQDEIAAANYPDMRLFQVKKVIRNTPQKDVFTENNTGWQVCSSKTIPEFSAVAYFFGRDLLKNRKVPVGLIHTSWGGTPAESWVSAESLETMPYFKDYVRQLKQVSQNDLSLFYIGQLKEWQRKVEEIDLGYEKHYAKWASPDFDDVKWEDMPVPGSWENSVLPDFDGVVWVRKTIEIPLRWQGKELTLRLGGIDDDDITFFNGEEVGHSEGWNVQREYNVPAGLVKAGKAVIAVRISDMALSGGFYGDPVTLQLMLKNSDSISLSGNWKYQIGLKQSEMPLKPISPVDNPKCPTTLYNAMLYPLAPFAFQGVIWYQGEANASMAEQYRTLFPLLIDDWRSLWKRNFPFYFVQLAAFNPERTEPYDSEWAALREAQLNTLHWNNTGMAVAMDIGNAKDIHPKNKQEVGRRLALIARAKTYGEDIPYSGPVFKAYRIEDDKIRISFSHVEGGLKTPNGESLKGFAICGSDRCYYWAEARIEGNEIIVFSPKVPRPYAVRYGWADNISCNLYNGAGLPASPFRTDSRY